MISDIDRQEGEMNKREFASMIVKYWYLIEFLEQPDFPMQSREGKALCLKASKEETCVKQITLYDNLSVQEKSGEIMIFEEPCMALQNDANIYPSHKILSDEIHICLGKLERHIFSDCLQQIFCEDLELPEKNHGKICLIGLKCDEQGKYIPDSFTISPLLWGICRLLAHTGELTKANMAEFLSIAEYESDVWLLGERLVELEDGKRAGKPLTRELLNSIMDEVEKEYLVKLIPKEKKMNREGAVIYRRYRSEADKLQDMDVFHYSDLANSFFAKDLQMVEKAIDRETFGNIPMEREILDYITGLYAEEMPGLHWLDFDKRIDVRNNIKKNGKDLVDFFHHYLDVKKAPLGKWPSKFMPCLMQQLAVNLSWKPSSENPPVFSVNGPPGTGKTTLLKEIIAGNIVERASLLIKYKDPDDAFVLQHFQDGDKRKRGYSDYCWGYYDFQDKKLKNYGMLVASCNNAAVENITKELPDGVALLKGISPKKNVEESVREGLLEVKDLFEIDKAGQEPYSVWNQQTGRSEIRKYPDIYFTKLANDLAKRRDGEWNCWGLISAPFGKTSNLKQYINSVLKPYIGSFGSNEVILRRKEEYADAVQRFKNQYQKVKRMEQKLQKLSSSREYFMRHQEKYINEIQKAEERQAQEIQNKTKIQKSIQELEQKIEIAESVLKNYQLELRDQQKYKLQQDKARQEAGNHIQNIRQKIMGLENSRRFLDIVLEIFRRPTMLSRTIQEQYQVLEKAEQVLCAEETKVRQMQQKLEENNRRYKEQKGVMIGFGKERKQLFEEQQTCLRSISQLGEQIENCRKKILKFSDTYLNQLKEASAQEGASSMTVLNEEFFKQYDSNDNEKSTAAQVSNPWYTEVYNREREKLFYEALQLHKAFLLGSKSCLWNFKNLLLLWKEPRSDDDKKVVAFSKRDRENAFGALLNTVFLLTPVLSTTFASAGTMLSPIRKMGEIGCLIIDEAGQAAPQMALGSLFRCRRAIIVGDPKQVEPVVTDELDLIKQVIQNEYTGHYQAKNLSVQGFADRLNMVGTTYIEQEKNLWVGCPLVVHRRCISPMFEISNSLSYNYIMKQQTIPPNPEKEASFCRESSGWINVSGSEKSNSGKNHFVEAQGKKAWELIQKAFQLTEEMPSLFVITPFTTVRDSMKKLLRSQREYSEDKRMAEWVETCIGTVHTFQGKEADQVIFLLGCDKNALSAVRWVNTNIVNVAVTRAKYRLYVIGDYTVWQYSDLFRKVKGILDSHALRTLQKAADVPETVQSKKQIERLMKEVPGADSLTMDGKLEDSLVMPFFQEIDNIWKNHTVTPEQLKVFGLTEEEMEKLPSMIRQRLVSSILLHEFFDVMREQYCVEEMDASCVGILFCKTMESMLKEMLLDKLKNLFPEEKIYKEKLCNLREERVTTGTFTYILEQEKIRSYLAGRRVLLSGEVCDEQWWMIYAEGLEEFRKLRNICCHSEPLGWEQEKKLIQILFERQEFMKTMVGDSL